ncbi:MAG: CheR family methyltransferase [Brevinema sp.]
MSYSTPDDILQNIAGLIHTHSGIDFPKTHIKVLDQRIQKRIQELRCSESDLYSDLLLDKTKLLEFVGFVTTNHTHFFRSIEQFHLLGSTILPELQIKNSHIKHITLWSSACSSGEEPYTLALYLQHYFEVQGLRDWSYSIIATDIDQSSLDTAIEGVYPHKALKYIPTEYHSYIEIHDPSPETALDPTLEDDSYIKMKTEIRKNIRFQIHNLMDIPIYKNLDIIFCRNVLIYFNLETQEKVIKQLAGCLSKDRYLFISPAESITDLDVPFSPVFLPKSIYYINKK